MFRATPPSGTASLNSLSQPRPVPRTEPVSSHEYHWDLLWEGREQVTRVPVHRDFLRSTPLTTRTSPLITFLRDLFRPVCTDGRWGRVDDKNLRTREDHPGHLCTECQDPVWGNTLRPPEHPSVRGPHPGTSLRGASGTRRLTPTFGGYGCRETGV